MKELIALLSLAKSAAVTEIAKANQQLKAAWDKEAALGLPLPSAEQVLKVLVELKPLSKGAEALIDREDLKVKLAVGLSLDQAIAVLQTQAALESAPPAKAKGSAKGSGKESEPEKGGSES